MAAAAAARGLEYLAITEHSKRLTVAHGLDSRRLLAQLEAIDEFNAGKHEVTLLKGIEVDILEDGSLDLPDAVLERLDLVIGAVHSGFELSRARQTQRILRAMDNPRFTLLAHPTGRLIERRAPYDVDMPRIIRHARERGCYLELNANPERLDLLDTHCQLAREEGVLVQDTEEVARAANALTELGVRAGEAGVPALMEALKSTDPNVRFEASVGATAVRYADLRRWWLPQDSRRLPGFRHPLLSWRRRHTA